jgi:23S rRNA (cytosine1962-C5)-methyltransferase
MTTTLAPPPIAPAPATGIDDPATRPQIRVLPGRHKRARAGHPWVFSNEIDMTAAARALLPGTLVTLVDGGGAPIGVATFSPHPLISARILDRDAATVIDRRFIATRIERAAGLRAKLVDGPFHRLVHAEADGLPGLIADRYDGLVVVQMNTAGMDRLSDEIVAALEMVLAPRAVYLRNDSPSRRLEGLAAETRLARGTLDGPLTLVENGARYLADPKSGQKTGWFFDHRDNRALMARLAAGGRMLDVYAYLGGFGLLAALGGATEVICVDRSEAALALAEQAAALNGVAERCSFVRAEAFAELARRNAADERFDVVVCDPPAFVKARKDLRVGIKGYRKLVRRAAALVADGGFLFVASCSHHVDADLFAEQVRGGLRDAGRSGRILHAGGAAPDHPIHPYLPESAYLKCMALQLD